MSDLKTFAQVKSKELFANSTGVIQGMAAELIEIGAAWQRERDAEIADKHNGNTIAHEIRGQAFDDTEKK